MKESSRILYIIGNILYILRTVLVLITIAIFGLVLGMAESNADANYTYEVNGTVQEMPIEYFRLGALVVIVILALCVVMGIIKIIFGFKGLIALSKENNTKTIHIVNIILGVLTCSIFYLVAGILAMYDNSANKA